MLALFLSLLLLATPTVALEPSGPWKVNYASRSCLLERNFGEGPGRVTLAFSGTVLADDPDTVLLKTYDGRALSSFSGNVLLSSNVQPTAIKAPYEASRPLKDHSQFFRITLPAGLGKLAPLEYMTMKIGDAEALSVKMSAMPSAAKALKGCVDDLSRTFGIDPDEKAKTSTPAKPIIGEEGWVKLSDYPGNGEQGTVVFIFAIGIDGKASNCRILETSGSERLDNAACRAIISRARFQPALDRDGKPMVTHSKHRVKWIALLS